MTIAKDNNTTITLQLTALQEQVFQLSPTAKADYYTRLEKAKIIVVDASYHENKASTLNQHIVFQRNDLQKSQWFYLGVCIFLIAAEFLSIIELTLLYFVISFLAYLMYGFAISQFKIPRLLDQKAFHTNQVTHKTHQWFQCVGHHLRPHAYINANNKNDITKDDYFHAQARELALQQAVYMKARRLDV